MISINVVLLLIGEIICLSNLKNSLLFLVIIFLKNSLCIISKSLFLIFFHNFPFEGNSILAKISKKERPNEKTSHLLSIFEFDILSLLSNNSLDIYLESPSIISSIKDNSSTLWHKPKSLSLI